MARDDDSFWFDILKKAPVVTCIMAVGGIVGCLIAVTYVGSVGHGRGMGRVFQCAAVFGGLTGLFVGLILGVIVDSLIGCLRGNRKRERKKKT